MTLRRVVVERRDGSREVVAVAPGELRIIIEELDASAHPALPWREVGNVEPGRASLSVTKAGAMAAANVLKGYNP